MASIKDRLKKLNKDAKERSRQLSQKDTTADLRYSSSHSSGSGSLDNVSKILTASSCSQFNLNGTAASSSVVASSAIPVVHDENRRPMSQNAKGHPLVSSHLQRQQNYPIAAVTPHALEQSSSKHCSSSCSNLPPLAAVMETPLNSGSAGDRMAAPRLPKSLSSGSIVYSARSTSLANNNGGGGASGQKVIKVAGHTYEVLNLLGKGGSSCVYQAYSRADKQCVAIKCVNLKNADELVRQSYENEIKLLESLQGSPYVIKMFNYETRNNCLFVVMERGDIDLATFMQKRSEQIDAKFIKYHWQEMLRCVKVIHDMNIVHSDLKPANFLFVGASLKLIDFGIASNIPSNKTSVLKDLQIGTLNYMSPEAINGSYTREDGTQLYKIPLKSDVWSLGCILYAMVYGKTPFQHLPNQWSKVNAISSESERIEFPPIKDKLLMDVIKRCLIRDVKERASVDELLAHPYLRE